MERWVAAAFAAWSGLVGAASEPAPGAWEMRTKVSPMDDSRVVHVGVKAPAYKDGTGGTRVPFFFVSCDEGAQTSTIVYLGEHIAGQVTPVRYRIGDQEPERAVWDVTTSGRSAGLFGADAVRWIQRLPGHGRLVVRIRPYGENPRTVVFPIAKIEEAVEPVRKTCGW